jgi:hypothetical protein
MEGYVYVMINPAFPGLVKIGRTINAPNERAMALSTTGVPDKFAEAHSVLAKDCIVLEAKLHEYFADRRYADNREFFKISVEEAIKAFYLFADLWISRSGNQIEVSLYAYLIRGPILTAEIQEEISRFRNSSGHSIDAISFLNGKIRIGCLRNEEKSVSGNDFLLRVDTLAYLKSKDFRDLLADYYKTLVGRPVLLDPCAALLHSRSFKVSEDFFGSFATKIETLFSEMVTDTRMCFDKQTFVNDDSLYEILLGYSDLLFEFDSEQVRVQNENEQAKLEAKELERRESTRGFKGRV